LLIRLSRQAALLDALVVATGVTLPQTQLPGIPPIRPSTAMTPALQPSGLQSQSQQPL
jgi:hypothetical protein